MGVPTFFRWISEKYPKIVQRCIEEEANIFADGSEMPIDAMQPNPNGMEFDNLYLDMNGIIHPCTHPENGEELPTFELMFAAIGKHIERLFRAVRPRKLLYMAIDGIAPRAKMNQQRSRRFRSGLEADEARADREKVMKSMRSQGLRVPDKDDESKFDSNVITPGTEFMDKLAEYLRHFIIERQANDPAWAQCKVILSDAQSPGEGEHKIMQFVRRQRAEAGHDPNCHHVMYGLDADLIMLGLASHEVMFTVLRDVVFFGKGNRKAGAKQDQVLQASAGATESNEEPLPRATGELSASKLKPFEMLHVWVLREYLQHEFRPESFEGPLPFPYDFERCIDDFVFLCFFVGNDFLPHLPSLSIREGGLELLINLYRKVLPTLSGFLTEDGDLHLGRVGAMMKVLGTVEDRIFQLRKMQEDREKQRKKMLKNAVANNGRGASNEQEDDSRGGNPLLVKYSSKPSGGAAPRRVDVTSLPPTSVDARTLVPLGPSSKKARVEEEEEKKPAPTKSENKSAAAALRAQLNAPKTKKSEEVPAEEEEEATFGDEKSATRDDGDEEVDEVVAELEEEVLDPTLSYEDRLKLLQAKRNEPTEEVDDPIRLGEEGWKDRYYESKFGKEFASDPAKKRNVVESYVRGLCWVLQYYYKGCQSWKWYFEYHYSPFASDLVDLESINLDWAASRPFKPFEQLMAVLPPQSANALPEPCRWYMTSPDSEIADFYPREIQFDPNGKPVKWLWVALLPFIDESRLLKVTALIEDKLTIDEKRRNATMPDLIFVPRNAMGAAAIQGVLGKSPPNLLPNWESDQIAILKRKEEQSKLFEDALELPAPTTAGDVRGGGRDDIFLSAPVAGGISGYFLPVAPEFTVHVGDKVKSPFPSVIENVNESQTFVCELRLPPMLPHLSRLCPGVTVPPPVLTEQDFQIRRPKLSGMDVSTLLGQQQQQPVNIHSSSGLDRSWGSSEPERKSNYQGHHSNPFLAPPPLLPGLTSRSSHPQRTYDQSAYSQPSRAYDQSAYSQPPSSASLLAQLQRTLQQHQQSWQSSGGQQQFNGAPSIAYGPPPPAASYSSYGYNSQYPQQQQQQPPPAYYDNYGREQAPSQSSYGYPPQQQQYYYPPPPLNQGYGYQEGNGSYRPPQNGSSSSSSRGGYSSQQQQRQYRS